MSLLSDIGTAIKNKLGGTSVDNTVPRYDGTTCKLQGSGVTISDTNAVTASGGFVGNLTGNASTSTKLNNSATNWYGTGAIDSVVGMLSWKNYSNGHVIFDASNSTSPTGTAVNNTNAQTPWASSYPTLMGWNGGQTYGVRVDSARVADYASNSGSSIGYNQTWQDVTASRAGGVTYTNSTGKPIMVLIAFYNDITLYIAAIPYFTANNEGLANATSNISLIIPSGTTYRFDSLYGITKWMELR